MKRATTEHSSSSSSSYHYRRTDGTLASLPFATRTPPPPTAGGGAEETTSPKRARIVSSSSSSSSFSNRLEGSFASRKESLERHHHQRNIDPAFGGGLLGEEGPRHVDWKALGRDFREKRRQTDAANAWNGKPQKYEILARRGGERQHAE